ncbi:AI-2E family transporter [Haloarchaeobius sp. TZWWS8]|uniref:AI-2E family transporter n=1 Tax=Haloarchaeobius sp. TZWWS8 TaxID=3446121 RepID=UPI003EBD8ED3
MELLVDRETDAFVWLAAGFVLVSVVAFALFDYIGSVVTALFLYYATRPLHRRLDDHVEHSNLQVVATVLVVLLPMVAVLGYGLLLGLQELNTVLSGSSMEGYRNSLQPYIGLAKHGHLEALWQVAQGKTSSSVMATARSALKPALGAATVVFAVLSRLFLISVFLFYLLRDDHKLRAWFLGSVELDDRTRDLVESVDDDLETVFFGNLAVVAVSAGIATVTYLLLNLVVPGPDIVTIPILLGLLTGMGMLIPVIGMKLVYLPYAGYLVFAALAGSIPMWYPLVFLAVAALLVDTIPDFFVRSLLAARSGIHMGLILLGYVLGTMVFGWYGLFLGPLVVVLVVHFGKTVFPRLAGELTLG